MATTGSKNSPPKGVVLAIALIALLIIFYFVIAAVFPDMFSGLNTGETVPVKPQ